MVNLVLIITDNAEDKKVLGDTLAIAKDGPCH